MQIVLTVLILNLYLLFLSFYRIRKNTERAEFIYQWGFLIGAFIWEDLFLISLFLSSASVVVLLVQDIRVGFLLFNVYWIVRSAGEVLYFFLEQFLEPKHHPHEIDEHFKIIRRIFGNLSTQKCFIIMQVTLQLGLVTFISCLIYLLWNWHTLPTWF
jgi:hypothetical protein